MNVLESTLYSLSQQTFGAECTTTVAVTKAAIDALALVALAFFLIACTGTASFVTTIVSSSALAVCTMIHVIQLKERKHLTSH